MLCTSLSDTMQARVLHTFGKLWKLNGLSTGVGGGFLNMWRLTVTVVNISLDFPASMAKWVPYVQNLGTVPK